MFQFTQHLAPLVDLSVGSQSDYSNTSKRVTFEGGGRKKHLSYIDFGHFFALSFDFFFLFGLISVSCFRTCKPSFPCADVSETLMINEDVLGELQSD